MKAINIVGCGRAGRTLARLFHHSHAFVVQDLYDVNAAAARACARFADAGEPVRSLSRLRPAPVWLIATPDDAIAEAAEHIAAQAPIARGNVAVHMSGATPSTALAALIEQGAHAGSFHPNTTFADPGYAAASFGGTYVALEGDRKAVKVMRTALRKLGARVFELEPEAKLLYHAGGVMVCNYLCALMEAGLRCYDAAGIKLEIAYALTEPLVRQTVDNVFRVGSVRALSGPIARGDHATVARQLEAVRRHDPRLATLYQALGSLALDLARSQGRADAAALAKVARALRA